MKLTKNTIFITAGGMGLVVALAEALHKPGNKVTLRRLIGIRRVTRFANVEKLQTKLQKGRRDQSALAPKATIKG
jgi:short-subunit dehydrogenase involved in D-alanine esterification of teichoic acids